MSAHDAPPWQDREEPDFMPRLRRQFAASLPDRLRTMREATAALRRTVTPEEVERLFMAAHGLVGSAAGYGADNLHPGAKTIEELARQWHREGRAVHPEDVDRVEGALGVLSDEIDRFVEWVDDAPDGTTE